MGSEEDPQDDGGAGWQGVRTHTKNERLTDLSRIWLFYHKITSRFSWANATSSLIKRKLLGEGRWGRRENKRKKKTFLEGNIWWEDNAWTREPVISRHSFVKCQQPSYFSRYFWCFPKGRRNCDVICETEVILCNWVMNAAHEHGIRLHEGLLLNLDGSERMNGYEAKILDVVAGGAGPYDLVSTRPCPTGVRALRPAARGRVILLWRFLGWDTRQLEYFQDMCVCVCVSLIISEVLPFWSLMAGSGPCLIHILTPSLRGEMARVAPKVVLAAEQRYNSTRRLRKAGSGDWNWRSSFGEFQVKRGLLEHQPALG